MTRDEGAARQLARLVCSASFTDFPAGTVAKAKHHILDTLGVALAGSASAETRTIIQSLGLRHDAGRSAVWGMPFSVNARTAAFMNGISAHACELDDSGGCDHSGAVVVPAALAMLPETAGPISGRKLIHAVLMGYEVGRRVLEASGGYESHNGAGWHSTGTCGVFGAATAAGLLLGLDEEKLTEALGIACSFAGGTWSFIHDGSPTKKLHPGRAAEGGVTAALLAARSFRGPSRVFDADAWGSFFKTFAAGDSDMALLTSGFGENWRLNRCSIKPYATCRGTHSAIDAVKILSTTHSLLASDIKAVEVGMSGFQAGMCGGKSVASRADAQMSLPYAVAAQLEFGKVGLTELETPARTAPAIRDWLERIGIRIDPEMADEDEPVVTLVAMDGRRHRTVVPFPYGSPSNPLPDDELIGKFTDLASGVLPELRLDAVLGTILGLDETADIRSLPALLLSDIDDRRLG